MQRICYDVPMAEVETYKMHALSSSQKSVAVSTCTKNFRVHQNGGDFPSTVN